MACKLSGHNTWMRMKFSLISLPCAAPTNKHTLFLIIESNISPLLCSMFPLLCWSKNFFFIYVCEFRFSYFPYLHIHPIVSMRQLWISYLDSAPPTCLSGTPSSHCSKKWPWKDAKYHGNILSHYLLPCQSVATNSKFEPSTTLLTSSFLAFLATNEYLHIYDTRKLSGIENTKWFS